MKKSSVLGGARSGGAKSSSSAAAACTILLALTLKAGVAESAEAAPEPPAEPAAPSARHGGAAIRFLGTHNLLRTSHFGWTTSMTTGLISDDNPGKEGERVTMGFVLSPRLSFVETEDHWAFASVEVPWEIELTNSGTTTQLREVQVADMPIGAGYRYTLLRDDKERSRTIAPAVPLATPPGKTSAHATRRGKSRARSLGSCASARVCLLGSLTGPRDEQASSWTKTRAAARLRRDDRDLLGDR